MARPGDDGGAARPSDAKAAPAAPHPVLGADALPISYPVRPDPLIGIDPLKIANPAVRARQAQRLRRIRRWRRPLERGRDRLRAWINMLIVDHGFIRAVYPNMWRVTERMWRSGQPLPFHIHRFARRGGRAVISLRGGQTFGSLPLEIEACMDDKIAFHTIVLRSRDLPDREELLQIIDALPRLETPVLFHCKSGADRAGFMATLWMLVMEGASLAEAQEHLGLRYGHIRRSKTGVLDACFDAYAAAGGHDGRPFRDWVEKEYDPKAIKAAFRPAGLPSLIGDILLRRE